NFGELEHRGSGDRQQTIHGIGAAQCGRERQEMERQEHRQRNARQAVQQRGDKSRLAVRGNHGMDMASVALTPRIRSKMENAASARSSESARLRLHSRTTLRRPMGAWIATAVTNTR